MNVITLSGYSAIADVDKLELGTFDSYGIERLQVVKGSGWRDLSVIATFNPPSKGTPVSVALIDAGGELVFDVPPEATANTYGKGNIVFVGKKDGVQRISVDINYYVKMHSNSEGETPSEPTPDVIQQILTAAENAGKAAEEAKEAASAVDVKAQSALDLATELNVTVGQHTDEIGKLKQDFIDAQNSLNVLVGHSIGTQATCNNAVANQFRGLIVCGKSSQTGIPSVDSPATITTVGSDGSVKVDFSDETEQSKQIAFAVSGGLRGLPVSSGGNVVYNGQMYIADYIDAERGKLVRRIGQKNISDEISNKINSLTFRATTGGYELGSDSNSFFNGAAMSEQLQVMSNGDLYNNATGYAISPQWISLPKAAYADKGSYAIFFHEHAITLDYVLEEPVEYDLTQDEVIAYKELVAYAPTTVVSASDSAMVEVTYPRDINSAISSIITAILNMGGNLDGKDDNTWLLTN